MGSADKYHTFRAEKDQPTAEQQRLPWRAPKLIVERRIEPLTGTHRTTSGADVDPYISNVS
jgi:hypothetical protein